MSESQQLTKEYLTNLPVKLRLQILEEVLCLKDRWLVEDPCGLPVFSDAGTSIICASDGLYWLSIEVLYSKNTFKFTQLAELKAFVDMINKFQPLSHLIREVELVVNIFAGDCQSWGEYFEHDFMNDFPNLRSLGIDFPSYRDNLQHSFVDVVVDDDVLYIAEVLEKHVKAEKVMITGVSGEEADQLFQRVETAMSGSSWRTNRTPVKEWEDSSEETDNQETDDNNQETDEDGIFW